MDESISTCNKRFSEYGITQNEEMRRKYRQLIVTTPNLEDGIGGAILSDETINQVTDSGIPMANMLIDKGIVPGIKVDRSTVEMPRFAGEKITEGLDGLRPRLKEYRKQGARFAKWRAVITIDKSIPTTACITANNQALSLYASFCQEAGLVPIVEPEVLMDGDHTLHKCFEVTEQVLKNLFIRLDLFNVDLRGIILKPNMVVPGCKTSESSTIDEVADATFNCLLASVPATVPAIAFLSGGQSPQLASAHLNAIHQNFGNRLPWIVSFSFARAIQQPALEIWNGKDNTIQEAQKALATRASLNRSARKGKYNFNSDSVKIGL